MSTRSLLQSGKDPDVAIGPLKIWIHGRQFAEKTDYWDGNWLRASAHCASSGATVEASGSFLRTDELERWLQQIEALHRSLQGTAALEPLEPELRITLTGDGLGHISAVVELTPDQLRQEHTFRFELDQSYLPPLALQLRTVLQHHSVVGARP